MKSTGIRFARRLRPPLSDISSKMGYHLMLMNLKEPLKEGSSFKMTLKFEKAGEKEVTVSVQKMKEAMHNH